MSFFNANPNCSRDNNFDLLRLILAVLVFMAHWNALTSQNISSIWFNLGGIAVDMFFVVSGFLIFWSFDLDGNIKRFYIKRFFRVFPLYAIVILLQTIFFLFFSNGSFYDSICYFISNLFFLNFLYPTVGDVFSTLNVDAINGSLWTLKNEVAFYVIVPAIYFFHKKMKLTPLIFLYLLSFIYVCSVKQLGLEQLIVLFPGQLRLFIIGVLLYHLFSRFNQKNITIMLFVSVVVVVLDFDYFIVDFLLYPFCIGIIVLYVVFFLKPINVGFDFSYSLYILHFPVIQIFIYFSFDHYVPWLSFVSLFSLVLVLSYFSERFIEKRFVKLGRDMIKTRK
ncbi:acyltransferase family protein [Photobacterium sanguinicancri]|uniref:acyltransferase family protein n=1 Tax=Photobacterium sanguinicancri TaxID=875932 RepID=UPI0026E3B99A|nr:acyltransferase [Photobacterium sanguinicancri]MDO6499532.1 acyltransferase [Photobacterium sanguinicancri]